MIEDIRVREWFYTNKNDKRNETAKILGVEYAHLRLENKDDLYATTYGLPFIENLRPENFLTDENWFDENSTRLSGSSCLYKIRTKKIQGRFKDIVIKWNRMGQDIPGAEDCEELANAKFNSPFEEFSLVDFELLERTREREEMTRKIKRIDYLKRQKDRFAIEIPKKFDPHLSRVNIFGVDYVYGHVESTKGTLWVVGKDPYLFDYFLPERWEQTPKTKISMSSEVYHTVTKDNIHLVWEISRVGLQPDMDPFKEDEKKLLEYGYNSPFEKVALAVELSSEGIATTYPRAIYMTGNKTRISEELFDNSRYERHKGYLTPDGIPILKKSRDYVIIWGYWNGPDEKLAAKDGDYYEGINALRAYREGIITQETYITLLKVAKEKLSRVGIEDLNLRGNHLLISLDTAGTLITDSQGMPELRVCNFEFLRRIE